LPGFLVIGIEARTNNANEASSDGVIPRQWRRFFQEEVLGKIPNKTSSNTYALYTDYVYDRAGNYTFVIGAAVQNKTVAPPGMVAKFVPGGSYAVLSSDKGPVYQVVASAWQKVWKLEDDRKLSRAYKADFEVYDQRSQDPQNAQVDIYIGLK